MMQIDLPPLKEDCSSCAGLCCAAYPFAADEDFAILKDIDTPCPNLAKDFRCSIHPELKKRGFGGCTVYSCAGAGQRVTQQLFQGETWRDDPDLLTHMTYALRVLRPIHEALLLLVEAQKLPVPAAVAAEGQLLMAALCPAEATSVYDFEDHAVQDALAEVPDYLQSLAQFVQIP